MNLVSKIVVNMNFDMDSLLLALGVDTSMGASVYCPFHDDFKGGHKSAKFFKEDNSIYCWSCCRSYKPYDALSKLGVSDEEILVQLKAKGVNFDIQFPSIQENRSIFKNQDLEQLKRRFVSGGVNIDDYTEKVYGFVSE